MQKPIQLQMPGRPAGAQAETPPPAGPGILFAAPHRPMFLAGAAQTVLAFLPWVWELLARNGLLAGPAWPWPPGWVHGLWALYGVFPFFVFGFLMTAMPRWQGLADTPGAAARGPWLCLVAGWLLAFTLSVDDLVITSFVSGPNATTLPMVVFSSVRLGVSPKINALATLIILVVSIGTFIGWWMMASAEKRRKAEIKAAMQAG